MPSRKQLATFAGMGSGRRANLIALQNVSYAEKMCKESVGKESQKERGALRATLESTTCRLDVGHLCRIALQIGICCLPTLLPVACSVAVCSQTDSRKSMRFLPTRYPELGSRINRGTTNQVKTHTAGVVP